VSLDAGFLQDIAANPHDDAPRLIYADWLDDHGQPVRAEFIRLQIALAQMRDDDPARDALAERERVLLNEHQMDWAEPLLPLRALSWSFRRGFPTSVVFAAEDFLGHGADLFLRTAVRSVQLVTVPPVLSELVVSPLLGEVRKLDLTGCRLVDEELADLLASPHLGRLETLRLGMNRAGRATLRAIARSTVLGRLSRLALNGNRDIDEHGIEVLAAAPHLAELRRLDLSGCQIGRVGARALAQSPYLGRLEQLELAQVRNLGLGGLWDLAASSCLPSLVALDLDGTSCGDEGATALANLPLLNQLRRLRLDRTVTAAGLRAVLESPGLRHLSSLHLWQNWSPSEPGQRSKLPLAPDELQMAVPVPLDVFGALRASTLPPGLAGLHIHRFPLREDDVRLLAEWAPLAGRASLSVRGARIDNGAVQALALSPLASGLRRLRLCGDTLDESTARALLTSSHLADLETLEIDINPSRTPAQPAPGLSTLRLLADDPRVRVRGSDLDALERWHDWPLPWRSWLSGPRCDRLLFRRELRGQDEDSLMELLEMPRLLQLTRLDLSQARGGLRLARALARSPYVANLSSLGLSLNPIGDEGAAILASSPHLGKLRTLKLSICGIGDEGARALAGSPGLSGLTTLKLWGDDATRIGDAGASAIAFSPHLARLVILRLRNNRIGDPGARAFVESPFLQHMLDLDLTRNRIGEAAQNELRRRFGGRLGSASGEWEQG
jgi:uncharacterized protein (TIGR02996 family)